jgi:hypothetical protein
LPPVEHLTFLKCLIEDEATSYLPLNAYLRIFERLIIYSCKNKQMNKVIVNNIPNLINGDKLKLINIIAPKTIIE